MTDPCEALAEAARKLVNSAAASSGELCSALAAYEAGSEVRKCERQVVEVAMAFFAEEIGDDETWGDSDQGRAYYALLAARKKVQQ